MRIDLKKAKYYYELADVGGDAGARFNLGCIENNAGNTNTRRAVKHFMIALYVRTKRRRQGM